EGTTRIVQPDVDALHEITPDVNVIVFDKNKFIGEAGVAHQFRNLLQHFLSALIMRMRFAGKDKLHRTFRVVDHQGQILDVGQNQVGSFVGGEAAGKADG